MPKKMLINALHAEEARVAIVEDGRLVDLDVEIAGSEQIRGNIYKGVVVRVEPGLQAAFVDVGLQKLGFLQMGELHPDNWKWRDDVPEDQRHRRPRIQEVLRRGQELILQVEKGERDNKGSALTTYISLPGRYMVLMPGSDSSGISRKVESESERKKLKEIISEMTIPPGYGYIIRTEAMGRTREELQKDLDNLVALYEDVRTKGDAMKGAGLIYQESALIIRTIRDYFSADIDEVLVDSKDVYQDVRECLKEIDPKFEKLVKMHQEKRPIFSRYQLEEQIDLIYEKKVPLKSGGSIFIEPTEALVSIDVNSGKSTGEKGVEDTAFKTNLEAAEEAARQLRLRDLGGLIVIDFIDMRDRKHNAEVERTLKAALKADKARVSVSRISEFGLLEMSRQRIRQTLHQASTLECPHCDGRGKVKSVEAMALSFLRKVHAAAAKGTIGEVVGSLPLEVAYYLLNRKRSELSQIERDYDIEVTVKGKPSYLLNQMELELVKREKLPQEEGAEKAQRPPREEGAPAAEAAAEGRKKKKGKKAKVEHEAVGAPLEIALSIAEAVPAPLVPESAELAVGHLPAEGEADEGKKKRKRKRKRGKGGAAETAATEGAQEAAAEGAEGAEESAPAGAVSETAPGAPVEAGAEPAAEETRKKRRRKRRRGKGHEATAAESETAGHPPTEPAEEVAAGSEAPAQAQEGEALAAEGGAAAPAETPAHKKKRSRSRKRAHEAHPEPSAEEAHAGPAAEQAEPAEVVPAPAEAEPAGEAAPAAGEAAPAHKKKRSRSRKRAHEAHPAVAEAHHAEAPPEAPEAAAHPVQTAPEEVPSPAAGEPGKPRKKRGAGQGPRAKAPQGAAAAHEEIVPAAAATDLAASPAPAAAPVAETPVPVPAPAPAPAEAAAGPAAASETPAPGAKPKGPKARKAKGPKAPEAAAAAETAPTAPAAPVEAPPAPAAEPAAEGRPAAKKKPGPKKKGVAPADAQPAAPAPEAVVTPAEAKAKAVKPRAPRKKKEEAP